MQAINLWLLSAGLLTHIARLIIGKLQVFASAECIKSLSPPNTYELGTYQYASTHASIYDWLRDALRYTQSRTIREHDIVSSESSQVGQHSSRHAVKRLEISRILERVIEIQLPYSQTEALSGVTACACHVLRVCSVRASNPRLVLDL